MSYPITGINLLQVTLVQRFNDQRILNVLNYISPLSTDITDGREEVKNITDLVCGSVIPLMKVFQSNALTHVGAFGQLIYPTRRMREYRTSESGPGLINTPPLPQNVAASLTLRGLQANRHNIGRVQVAGLPYDANNGGFWSAEFMVFLEDLASVLKDDVASAVTWKPVILNQSNPAASVEIADALAQGTVRTQRTRNVGRGE